MTPSSYRAFSFHHPDTRGAAPGLATTATGTLEMVEGDDAIRQAIVLLLCTIPGERVMRPRYGCDLHSLVFAPNDDTTSGLAAHLVQRALEQWEPRVRLLRVDVDRHPRHPDRLDIVIEYAVLASGTADAVAVSVPLAAIPEP